MTRAVVLEHTLPDGSRHYDWMIERPGSGEDRRLCTWRTERRPDATDRFRGERIGDHRVAYLQFEGELSGGRGRVRRVASGRVTRVHLDEGAVSVCIDWQDGRIVRYNGEIEADGSWCFSGSPE